MSALNNFCNSNQQMHKIAIRFTIIFLERLKSNMFQTLLVHHQVVYYLMYEGESKSEGNF